MNGWSAGGWKKLHRYADDQKDWSGEEGGVLKEGKEVKVLGDGGENKRMQDEVRGWAERGGG